MKALLMFIFGLAVASFSLGLAMHGAPEWQAMLCLIIGSAMTIYSLFMLARFP